ncbi:GNAT family N-acetyltransferase [Candidatus Saccharibacteria bacterium]|jgi:lincosamide nucleotidyltransferase A/C/D/E|nr:GNAT family N-acetyltransferase [Candidatus Saccharibacteria bacterium]
MHNPNNYQNPLDGTETTKPNVIIEAAKPEDAEAVFNVQRETWLDTYPNEELGITQEDIRKRVEGDNGELVQTKIDRWRAVIETAGDKRVVFVARNEGEIVGFVAPAIMEGQRRIGAIYVLPETQGLGVGSKLIQQALNWHGQAEDVYLHVATYNRIAIDFYKQYGFEITDAEIQDDFAIQNGYKEIPEIEMVLKAKTGEQIRDKEMKSKDVVELVRLLEQNNIEVYVDGGWGVDALLGEQTRKHGDLDIATPHKFVPRIRELLATKGYEEVPRDDTRDCNFVLGDGNGHEVDVHSYTFDENGNNIFGVAYEPRHLTGIGTIDDYPVKCIPADVMVAFHSGYELDADDYHDVKALCERHNIPLPEEYKKFTEQRQL